VTDLRSFRVYRHEAADVYRETVARRDGDSLPGNVFLALWTASAKATSSQSKTFGFKQRRRLRRWRAPS